MPEQPYFPRTTARELVEDHARLIGMSKAEAEMKAEGALERVALRRDAWNEPLRSYSKGMIQRTGLAQAIVGDPKLLVLDEPMSGLDPTGRYQVREMLESPSKGERPLSFPAISWAMSPRFVTVLRCLRAGRSLHLANSKISPPPKEWEWIAQFSAETDFNVHLLILRHR